VLLSEQNAGPLYVGTDGTMQPGRAWEPTALLSGAFNPVHAGHWGLAEIAAQLLEMSVAFELSIANVDKPELSETEVRRRVAQFTGRAPVWLTYAPGFVHKARLFAGAVFVVGADTALRLVSARYYDNDTARLHAALELLRQQGCRFLVGCRIDSTGRCLRLADLSIPPDYHALFVEIPPERFRLDLSSTELRTRGHRI
jgi:hypothetical protein